MRLTVEINIAPDTDAPLTQTRKVLDLVVASLASYKDLRDGNGVKIHIGSENSPVTCTARLEDPEGKAS